MIPPLILKNMKTLFIILIAFNVNAQNCHLSTVELKARGMSRDTTTKVTWLINDPMTCYTVAYERAEDSVIVVKDFPKT